MFASNGGRGTEGSNGLLGESHITHKRSRSEVRVGGQTTASSLRMTMMMRMRIDLSCFPPILG